MPGHLGEGNRGGDLGEGFVILLSHARVGGKDDIGLAVVDGLEVKAVGVVEEYGRLSAQGLVGLGDPGPRAVLVDQAVVGRRIAHRRDAQGEWGLHVAPGKADHALRLLLDHRLAIGVLDSDGEDAGFRGIAIGSRLLVGMGRRGTGHAEACRAGQGSDADSKGAAGKTKVHREILSARDG